ncbi:phosphoenolpyruvate--protein phosphotransferase [candidate division KSB1 bacterium]|nr:MAG: phosphoenolpyruvate--protein phosphotransferase [candidate division KSB1 bacterium]
MKLKKLKGKPASPGITSGKIVILDEDHLNIEDKNIHPENIDGEIEKLLRAIEITRKELIQIRNNVNKTIGIEKGAIFDTHIMFLQDKILLNRIIDKIKNTRKSADFVFYNEMKRIQNILENSKEEYIKDRALDIKDVKRRVIRNIQGISPRKFLFSNENVILVCYELTPSEAISLNKKNILGFVTELGGQTSHVAILARSLELPCVVGIPDLMKKIKPDDTLIIDGNRGEIIINPSSYVNEKYKKYKTDFEKHKIELEKITNLPCVTLDNKKIELSANIEIPEEVQSAISQGAYGIGLFRTEYIYLTKTDLPSEETQFKEYKTIVEKVAPNPVIIRTLDIGGDKFTRSLFHPKEENPFLGWRSIRICLDNPEIFKTQLRAILRASSFGKVKIMFPMISSFEELKKAKWILKQTATKLEKEKIPFDSNIEIGVMIEVPSAVIIAEHLAAEVDFFSIGTNDLVQYTLAADRGNYRVSHLYKFLQPAIIRMIKSIIETGHKKNIWVGMCGEMAGDPISTLLLLGLDIDELSVSPVALTKIKKILLNSRFSEAKLIAEKCLKLKTARQIENYLKKEMLKRFPDLITNYI